MGVEADESFKRPGSVPFKWEIQPGIPKEGHQMKPTAHHHQYSHKLRPPPAGISFYPPHQGALFVRIPSRSKSTERRRSRKPTPPGRPSAKVVSVGCFAMSSPRWKAEKKSACVEVDDEIGAVDVSDLQTLSRWSTSSRMSLSPFQGSPSSASFRTPSRRAAKEDAEWAAYGLF
ncbi:hypothetical protein ACLOJK_016834 [Asimina triloba]